MFSNFPESEIVGADKFQLNIAERCLQKLIDDLITSAGKLLDYDCIAYPSIDGVDEIYKRFNQLVPPRNISSLADVINAGWQVYEDIGEENSRGLKELILKTIEVFEIEQIIAEQTILEEQQQAEQVVLVEVTTAVPELEQEYQPTLLNT